MVSRKIMMNTLSEYIIMNKFDFMMYLLFGDKVRSITILLAIIFDLIYFK